MIAHFQILSFEKFSHVAWQKSSSSCEYIGLLVRDNSSCPRKYDKSFLIEKSFLLYFLAEIIKNRHVLWRYFSFELVKLFLVDFCPHFHSLKVVLNKFCVSESKRANNRWIFLQSLHPFIFIELIFQLWKLKVSLKGFYVVFKLLIALVLLQLRCDLEIVKNFPFNNFEALFHPFRTAWRRKHFMIHLNVLSEL